MPLFVQTYTNYTTKITILTIRLLFLSSYNLFARHICTLFCTQLRCLNMQLFCSLATSLKADWILTDCRPLCLVFLHTHTFRLQNVLKVEASWSRLLESSTATVCVCDFSYLFVPFSLILIVVGLFGTCSMYLWVCICALRTHRLLLNLLSLSYSWYLFL